MEGNVIFKTSTRGFNKKEVMEYIASLCEINASNVSALKRMQSEVQEIKSEKEELIIENQKLAEENKMFAELIEDSKKVIDELNAKIAELDEKASKVNEIEGAEEKANKLMMDSLRYSESCIKNARKVTASINLSTKKKISKAKDCLDTVSDDFKSLTDQIEMSISEISQRLANLSDGLEEN